VQTGLKLQTLGSYVERVDDVLSKTPERGVQSERPAPDLLGEIELRNLSFRYSEAGPWAVQDVSLRVPAGSRVAIVGRSGSGKSSLARLLVGLYKPERGQILYDGQDLADRDVDSIRRQIGFVPQFPFLFGASIRDNIALTQPDAPLESVERAAQLACIHDEIAAMPLRYDTPVASGGASLAGGQCQRIAIARAILHRPPILVLDEATSNLDAVGESRIHENLSKIHCTQILIAHRLSTIVDASLIVVMEQGRVVERGTHAELLRQGGPYATLFENQMRRVRDQAAE
jgi:ABC-type bacteriocin/lantibiotic exporter with double-glycine peptidase domain